MVRCTAQQLGLVGQRINQGLAVKAVLSHDHSGWTVPSDLDGAAGIRWTWHLTPNEARLAIYKYVQQDTSQLLIYHSGALCATALLVGKLVLKPRVRL